MSNGVDELTMPRTETEERMIAQLCADPFALPNAARLRLFGTLQDAQRSWLRRIVELVEPPRPDSTFPAFLLELPPFAPLARRIGTTAKRSELGTGVLDELQRFVDLFRGWLESDPVPDAWALEHEAARSA